MWTVRLFVDAGVYSSTCMVLDAAPQARLASSHVPTITHGEGRKHEAYYLGENAKMMTVHCFHYGPGDYRYPGLHRQ